MTFGPQGPQLKFKISNDHTHLWSIVTLLQKPPYTRTEHMHDDTVAAVTPSFHLRICYTVVHTVMVCFFLDN